MRVGVRVIAAVVFLSLFSGFSVYWFTGGRPFGVSHLTTCTLALAHQELRKRNACACSKLKKTRNRFQIQKHSVIDIRNPGFITASVIQFPGLVPIDVSSSIRDQ